MVDHPSTLSPTRLRGQPLIFIGLVVTLWTGVRLGADWLPSWTEPATRPFAAHPPAAPSFTAPVPGTRRIAGQAPGNGADSNTGAGAATGTGTRLAERVEAMLPAPIANMIRAHVGARTLHVPIVRTGGASPARYSALHVPLPPAADRQDLAQNGPAGGPNGATTAAASPRTPAAATAPAATLPARTANSGGASRKASPPRGARPDAWSATAWLFWRDGSGPNALSRAGQLGGSQVGARIERRLVTVTDRLSLSAHGRLSAAMQSPAMPEAALGFTLRRASSRVPLSVGVERRVSLGDGARNAFALVATGGLNPTRVGPGLIAEAYAQSGLVGLHRRDPFIDGRATLTAALGAPLGEEMPIRAGVAVSGGAQPHVARLDIGPVIEARLPIGRQHPRLSLEWRQRIAGSARPDSGPALTIASDF